MASYNYPGLAHVDPYFRRPHQVTISPLQCSPPMRLHPQFHSIREETDAWLLAVSRPSTPDQAKLVVQSQFPLLLCAAYAGAEARHCAAVVKFAMWTFLLDDITDVRECGPAFFSSLESTLGRKVPLEHGSEGKRPPSASGLEIGQLLGQTLDRAMNTEGMQWWREMKELGMSPAMQKRFLNEMALSLEAQRKQAALRKAQCVPDVRSFVEMRRLAGGMLILLLLSEWCAGVEINEEGMERDEVELLWQMKLATVDHVIWVNDLLSLKWEYSNGELSNLPSVICNLRRRQSRGDSCTFQKSVDIVQHIVHKRDRDFARLLRRTASSSLMSIPGMQAYLQGMGDWMAGHLFWCYATSRYHGLDLKQPYPVHQPLTLHLQPTPFIPSAYLCSS